MSTYELDDKTLAIIRQLAEKHGCTVEELVSAVLRSECRSTASEDPVLGLFADEPELLDKVVELAYEARQHPLRQLEK